MNEERSLTVYGKTVACYEVIGGAVGIFAAVFPKTNPYTGTTGSLFFAVLLWCLAMLSYFAGIQLWKKKPLGKTLTLAVQLIQVPLILIKGFGLHFFLPLSIAIGLGPGNDVILNFHAGARVLLTSDIAGFQYAGVNLLALAVIILLPHVWKKASDITGRNE